MSSCGDSDEGNNAKTTNNNTLTTNNEGTATKNGETNGNNGTSNNNKSPDELQIEMGKKLFAMPAEGGNVFSCVACHGLKGEGAFLRPGHPMTGVTKRETFKNGQLDSLNDAVNSCLTEWMRAPTWEEDSDEMKALVALFERDAIGSGDELTFEIVDPPTDFSAGNAAEGQTLFNGACAVCHGVDAVGGPLAPPLNATELSVEYISERVRKSGSTDSKVYDELTGGIMPFWSKERLSDVEVVHISTFISELEEPVVDPDNNDPGPINNNPGRDCEKTHAKVGKVLNFSNLFHDVSGRAEVIDDCTIEITGFNYDGAGIDVRIWTGAGSPPNYGAGYGISEDLLKAGGYADVSFTLTLDENDSLDDIDGLSVWCVAVGISFGDGEFE